MNCVHNILTRSDAVVQQEKKHEHDRRDEASHDSAVPGRALYVRQNRLARLSCFFKQLRTPHLQDIFNIILAGLRVRISQQLSFFRLWCRDRNIQQMRSARIARGNHFGQGLVAIIHPQPIFHHFIDAPCLERFLKILCQRRPQI